jgi:hypothetical protein
VTNPALEDNVRLVQREAEPATCHRRKLPTKLKLIVVCERRLGADRYGVNEPEVEDTTGGPPASFIQEMTAVELPAEVPFSWTPPENVMLPVIGTAFALEARIPQVAPMAQSVRSSFFIGMCGLMTE